MPDPRKTKRNMKRRETKLKKQKLKPKSMQAPDTTELEETIDKKLEVHDETRKRYTSEAISLGKNFIELEDKKGLSRNKYVAFFRSRYPHVRDEKRRRYISFAKWVDLSVLPHLQDVSQKTLLLLIEICEKESLTPADLPNFLDENGLFPDYDVKDRKGAKDYRIRLRQELQAIKANRNASVPPSRDSVDLTRNEPYRKNIFSSFEEIDHLPSLPPELYDGIFHFKEFVEALANGQYSDTISFLLPDLYEIDIDIRKVLNTYNNRNRNPALRFDLNR